MRRNKSGDIQELLSIWLQEHLRERRRAARIYQRWGADAARGFVAKVSKIDLRCLRRAELRDLLDLETDHDGYARAVEAHRMAWSVAGWNARAPYSGPDGDHGTWKRGKGGGKKNAALATAWAAKERK